MTGHMTVLNCAATLACALCFAPAVQASASQLELKWNELGPVIAGHQVKLVLPGGAEIQGEAIAVREDTLLLNVKKTSDRKSYPKGQDAIPRASVTTLQIETIRGSGGRTIGVIVGALGGLILGGDLVAHTAHSEPAAISSFLGISAGSAIAGYYAGKASDRRVTTVKILPEL
jgi:hypothetical protein